MTAPPRSALIFAHVNDARRDLNAEVAPMLRQVVDRKTLYRIGKVIGAGGSANVHEAFRLEDSMRCVEKRFHISYTINVARELSILRKLQGGPNIIELLQVVRSPQDVSYSFMFERVDNMAPADRLAGLSDADICYYMFELLRALHYCHSRGIIHRDVKPDNVLIDPKRRQLRLIDFGVSDYYFPDRGLSTSVGTVAYRAPEMLLNYRGYDYAVDMWSFGCMLAELVFKIAPFFGQSHWGGTMHNIANALGNRVLREFAVAYGLRTRADGCNLMRPRAHRPWSQWAYQPNTQLTHHMRDLLDKVLEANPYRRMTAQQAMVHPFFREVRVALQQEGRQQQRRLPQMQQQQRQPQLRQLPQRQLPQRQHQPNGQRT